MKKNEETKTPQQEQNSSFKTIESITSYGTIKISENVIISIVKKAALKIDGITSLPSGSFVKCLTNFVKSSGIQDKSVKLEIKGSEIYVDLKVNVAYGKNIPELAIKVQSIVSEEVKNLTGMDVKKVNLEIDEVDSEKEEPSKEKV